MINRCPGQDKRNIHAELMRCPSCGYRVEMFSDEVKVKCPSCKALVCRERMPACVDWCRYARECVGEEKWQQMKGA